MSISIYWQISTSDNTLGVCKNQYFCLNKCAGWMPSWAPRAILTLITSGSHTNVTLSSCTSADTKHCATLPPCGSQHNDPFVCMENLKHFPWNVWQPVMPLTKQDIPQKIKHSAAQVLFGVFTNFKRASTLVTYFTLQVNTLNNEWKNEIQSFLTKMLN